MAEREIFNLTTRQFEGAETSEIAAEQQGLSEEQRAREKLEILQDEKFKDFAVRFMNIGEYREIMENKSIGMREAYIFGQHGPSFREYAEYAKKRQRGWADVAWEQTDWEHSIIDMNVYDILMQELKKAHEEAKNQREENTRSFVLKQFRGFAEKLIHEEPAVYRRIESRKDLPQERNALQEKLSAQLPQEKIKEIFEKGDALKSNYEVKELITSLTLPISEELKEDIAYILSWQINLKNDVAENSIDENTLKILNEFLKDPDYLEKDKGNLRKVINALSYSPKQYRRDSRQYNLALVLDISSAAVGGGALKQEWGYVGSAKDWKEESTYEKSNAILGAIATMPNKELWQEMVQRSSHAGEMAHPIFDSHGVVQWPKPKGDIDKEEIFDLDEKKFIPLNE